MMESMSDKELSLVAIAVYSMHRATAHYRNSTGHNEEEMFRFLQICCQSAVRGHFKSLHFLEEAVALRHARISSSIEVRPAQRAHPRFFAGS